jgi:hypothetical protein
LHLTGETPRAILILDQSSDVLGFPQVGKAPGLGVVKASETQTVKSRTQTKANPDVEADMTIVWESLPRLSEACLAWADEEL